MSEAGRIVANTYGLVWEINPSEFAALHRELELIQRWRPRFNVLGKPNGWRYTYVCLGRRPAPYVYLAARPPASASAFFGPVPAGRRALEAVRRVNDLFQLRDCPQKQEMVFAGPAGAVCRRTDPGLSAPRDRHLPGTVCGRLQSRRLRRPGPRRERLSARPGSEHCEGAARANDRGRSRSGVRAGRPAARQA